MLKLQLQRSKMRGKMLAHPCSKIKFSKQKPKFQKSEQQNRHNHEKNIFIGYRETYK